MPRRPRPISVACLLFCSGLCALIYQTVWLRDFRLIFGASTAASAAVLGIFMGGLGLGSAFLGRRAEVSAKPLRLYGSLELLIAALASITPALVAAVRWIYSATGGTVVLGYGLGTIVRLLLAAIVLIGPTFLMGGTLPAAARSIMRETDASRRFLALLYGANTLGAVTGAALSTFWLIEVLGNRTALWLACCLNALVAVIARSIGNSCGGEPNQTSPEPEAREEKARNSAAPPRVVIVSAAVVGFAFMIMELVWYRMLGPILGGSTFTFGLILVVALFGIGLGGFAYTLRSSDRLATLDGFAFACALEALFIIIPFALGDRLALLALLLRPLGAMGFASQVLGWAIIAGIVVLPAAVVAGYQFPMLIALLGKGQAGVARETGLAYAANTLGAIVGSLAGGFGLLPMLTAPGVWKMVAMLLAALAIFAALYAGRRSFGSLGFPFATAAATILLAFSSGPSAAWRHGGVGVGRVDLPTSSANSLRAWENGVRRAIVWEAEGVESSVGLSAVSALAFVVNGKIDGNSRQDAGTQVMSGLLGALLHPDPRSAMVVGLGTGSTAGWLGTLPGMERVDVVELEPAILEVARRCAPVNNDVMRNPKVHTIVGDAREVLITTPRSYDIIFSEPSNPYRAGIASLFTLDFYLAAQRRLAPGGLFVQWMQCYEIDSETLRTVLGTVSKAFPCVELWRTEVNDLIIIGSTSPNELQADVLRRRIAEPTMQRALFNAWRVNSLEGVLSHFVGNEELVRRVAQTNPEIATDDRNPLEYGFARGIGKNTDASVSNQIVAFARENRLDHPSRLEGDVNWEHVCAIEPGNEALEGAVAAEIAGESPLRRDHRIFFEHYLRFENAAAFQHARAVKLKPLSLIELEAIAECAVFTQDPIADSMIAALEPYSPSEAAGLRACQAAKRKEWRSAADQFNAVFRTWQSDPWVRPLILQECLYVVSQLGESCNDPALVRQLYDTLGTPFAVELLRESRLRLRFDLAKSAASNAANPLLTEALQPFESYPEWSRNFLQQRASAYRLLGHPRARLAERDLAEFISHELTPFDHHLRITPAAQPVSAAR